MGRRSRCRKRSAGRELNKSLPDRLRLLAEPVDFAHSRGFIHRDLKPDNVMIGTFGEVLVMDWGLATVGINGLNPEIASPLGAVHTPSRVTGQGSVLGTPGYMSPEQALGNTEVDHRTDIFALGAILRFMLTRSELGDLPLASARVPRSLQAICDKAMAADPNARYQSAEEMTSDVANYLNGEPVSAYSESLLEAHGPDLHPAQYPKPSNAVKNPWTRTKTSFFGELCSSNGRASKVSPFCKVGFTIPPAACQGLEALPVAEAVIRAPGHEWRLLSPRSA